MTIDKAHGTFAVLYLCRGITTKTDAVMYPPDFCQQFGKFIINETCV